MKYIFTLSFVFLFFSCTKKEDNVLPETEVEEEVPVIQTNNPSPCSSSLTDNQVESTPNVFPTSNVSLTAVLSDPTHINGIVPGFPQGGDINIQLGNSIAPGTYTLVDNPTPTTGQALISMTPISCSICPFKSTNGTLYITETSTQWILEWCNVNFNSSTVNPNSTVSGRIVINK